MKALQKSERKRFDHVCDVIRKSLHLEHKDCKYIYSTNKKTTAEAAARSSAEGWYLRIYIYPRFWEVSYEEQIRTLIHEHVHICMIPYDQQVNHAIEWMHEADKRWAESSTVKGCELAVCHLESVLFDLLRHKLM